MLKLKPIQERLLSRVAAFKKVQGAADLALAMSKGQFTSDAYLVPISRRANRNQVISAVSQRLDRVIAVIYVVRNASGTTGEKALEELEQRSEELLEALLGWKPQDDHTAFEFVRGQLLGFDGSTLIWSDEFLTQQQLRSPSNV